MISTELHLDDNFVEVHVEGRLSKQDYDDFVPRVEKLLEDQPSLGFLVEIESFESWEPQALTKEVAVDPKQRPALGRMAVVGDGPLAEWTTEVSNLVFPSEIRYFTKSDTEDARRWLRSPDIKEALDPN
jgi:hypothetical protein